MTIDANDLEKIAKERPDECFLKGSGVLKLIAAIRQLEREARRATVSSDAQRLESLLATVEREHKGMLAWKATAEQKDKDINQLTAQVTEPQKFDAWMANPYTKVLQKSVKEDYVPKSTVQAAPVQQEPVAAQQTVHPAEELADEQIIEKCRAAGICWLVPDADPDGFPGGFDMASMHAMRSLLSHAAKK